MKSISSSTDVHGTRYTEKRNLIQKIRRVTDIKEKQNNTSLGEYEERKMTQENKKRKDSITPQEIFRKEISNIQNSPVYRKLQNTTSNKEEKQEDNELDK